MEISSLLVLQQPYNMDNNFNSLMFSIFTKFLDIVRNKSILRNGLNWPEKYIFPAFQIFKDVGEYVCYRLGDRKHLIRIVLGTEIDSIFRLRWMRNSVQHNSEFTSPLPSLLFGLKKKESIRKKPPIHVIKFC